MVAVEEGSPSHLLSCAGEGQLTPHAVWYRVALAAGEGIAGEEPVQLPRGEIFSYRDSGDYVCVASNVRNTSRLSINLTVTSTWLWNTSFSCPLLLASERSKRDTLRSVQLKIEDIYIIVRAISVYSAGVPYAARLTAAVKIPLPLATFQF